MLDRRRCLGHAVLQHVDDPWVLGVVGDVVAVARWVELTRDPGSDDVGVVAQGVVDVPLVYAELGCDFAVADVLQNHLFGLHLDFFSYFWHLVIITRQKFEKYRRIFEGPGGRRAFPR